MTKKVAPITIFNAKSALVDLTFRLFGQYRQAATDGDGITVAESVEHSRVSATQRLLEKKAMKPMYQQMNRIKAIVRQYGIATDVLRPGQYIVPLAVLGKLIEVLDKEGAEFDKRADKFTDLYPERVDRARKDLGPLWRAEHYPTPEEVRDSFSFEYHVFEIRVPDTLAAVSAELHEREREKAEAMWAKAKENIEQALLVTFTELVDQMVYQTKPNEEGKKRRFTESYHQRLMTFLETFEHRNLFDKKGLKTLVSKARKVLDGKTIEELRTDETVRAHVHATFDELKNEMPKSTVVATRRIRFHDEVQVEE